MDVVVGIQGLNGLLWWDNVLGNGEGRFVRFIIGHNSLHFDSLLWRFRGGAARDKFQEFHDSLDII